MSRLVRGDFSRLFKSKVFWLGVIFMLGAAVVIVYVLWNQIQYERRFHPDYYGPPDFILLYGIMLFDGIVISIFAGIFIGSDYRYGTIRNKLIMGHSRTAIFLSNLIICFTSAFIMHIVYIAVIVGAAAAGLTDKFEMSPEEILIYILISVCSVLAMTSVILLLCMLIPSRTASTVVALVLSIMALFAAQMIDGIRYKGESVNTVLPDGYVVSHYVYIDDMSTTGRIIKFVNDYLPQNQLFQLVNRRSVDNIKLDKEIFPLYSLSLVALSTTAGILVFRKKDLK
ncbi:MAG: ABC transporter permease [Oscillospiraceae bacterium]|nr:ABC transporter permease [Oscillospiraceae bacterium]